MIVEWANELPAQHFLPIDHSLHGAGKDVPEVRGVVHLHGGRTPPESDGYPEEWVVPGSRRRATTLHRSMRRCSFITTTRWELTG